MPFYKNPIFLRYRVLVDELNERLIGQQFAKERLAIHVAEHEFGLFQKVGAPRVLLLVGPTGSGKTELCRSLAEVLGAKMTSVNASELSHTSFHGQQIANLVATLVVPNEERKSEKDEKEDEEGIPNELRLLGKLLELQAASATANSGLRKARGVMVIDEIDKVTFLPEEERKASQAQERHNFALQSMLLPLFEGGKMRTSGHGGGESNLEIDTSELLVIASGAFEAQRFKDVVGSRDEGAVTFQHGHWGAIQHGDLIRFGFLEELVGRIRTIIPLERWSDAELQALLKKQVDNAEWRILGYRVVPEDSVLEKLAEHASNLRLGARGANVIFETIKHHVYAQIQGIEIDDQQRAIVLTQAYTDKHWTL
ncbi:MAG: AAA family ATPase [Magnetococcales bacterium]|nr:AAA family ATPase [Magnetococcales bacterium]